MRRARVLLSIAAVRTLHDSGAGIRRCFSDAELARLPSRLDPVPSIAARLAAKLATREALGGEALGGEAPGGPWSLGPVDLAPLTNHEARWLCCVEVFTPPGSAPSLVLGEGATPGGSSRRGWVSLSHDAGLAAALVVL